ncbi:phosphoribosylformylglycinamidine synthase subunit PurL [Hydrogenivirga sp. 128-5-R1-1]|uniref:phosphoribosylformylglycinamidine synthase subunit PurL n=1 Tax=Hydrogenivirga sp. 128-5-R1-1 TaxID=392423 RepID=UPI00015F16C4|nr:phosphoribosylformylglycinamidine synthase subunit PurL [Hydrogenivirga sp. 128-5-R1-1]EDP76197.1 phosphoribosylformylglycinamidine synthase II [Hydrogenivirga sp. 128-5-R1-1]
MEKLWEAHGLSEEEYRKIVSYLGREPNNVELGVLGALWSEHCSYKSSRKVLRKFPNKADWVVQGPGENAGVVEVDENVWVAFKVESHNHPSFIEPFNGAATGVGGIIRDVLSMGARPIALADSLRFGELTDQRTRFLVRGVVKGISSYGNSIGVPTVAGETFFEDSYRTNPLVNAFCLGVMPAGRMFRAKATKTGQLLFLIGSSTGRDGIHGAVMASGEFGEDAEEKRPNVQVGDPYFGKKLIEAVLEAVERGLLVGMQDLGAAGLAGSASELASKSGMGVEIYLDRVPLREEGMNPYEILLSESQERMLLIIEEENLKHLEELANRYHLSYGVVGKTTEDKKFRALFGDELVAELPVSLIVDEAPLYERPIKEPSYIKELRSFEQNLLPEVDIKDSLLKLLSSPNLCSKAWVYSQYDYQVGTNTIVKPGGDAALLRLKWVERPELNSKRGIAISAEGNGRLVFLDPYEGGKYVVAEACRNVACTGAKPLAITDCLNFGNPERPEIMWQFVRAVEGMAEACEALNVPVVSGNVSLYNETIEKDKVRNVYPTPVIVCVGVLENAERFVDVYYPSTAELLLIGDLNRRSLIDGSEYLKVVHGVVKGGVPAVDLAKEKTLIDTLVELVREDLIESAHDVSSGGLLINILESLFVSRCGAELELYSDERADLFLFSEMPTRVVVSVDPSKSDQLKDFIEGRGLDWMYIGRVVSDRTLRVNYNGELLLQEEVEKLKEVWERSLEEAL